MSRIDDSDLHLRGVVHDLDNVFQAILDAADLLGTDSPGVAAVIQRSAERGLRLTHGLVEGRGGGASFVAAAESAMEFARDLVNGGRLRAVEFLLECHDPALGVPGSTIEWERVLVNLLLNAVQAMPAGGRVTMAASRGGGGTTITVWDDGPGIPSGMLSRVFEPHVSSKPANSGLGLHIVRTIVERNGGRVSVSNRSEGGAEFTITLP